MYIQEVINQGAEYIRRKTWLPMNYIKVSKNLHEMNLEYESLMANDWEEYVMPPIDETLEVLKHWLLNDLNFKANYASKYFNENYTYSLLFTIVWQYYINSEEQAKDLLLYIKNNSDKFNFK